MKKTTPDDIDEVEKELKRAKNARNDANLCLYKRPNSPLKKGIKKARKSGKKKYTY